MANQYRGEIDIILDNKSYTLRPTFQALCEIEGDLNKSIIDVLSGLNESKPKAIEIAKIIYHAAKAYDPNFALTYEQIGEGVFNTGILKVMPRIIRFLEISIGMEGSHER